MTNNERKAKLTSLIEMRPPDWLTPEIYQDYVARRKEYSAEFNMRLSLSELFKGIPDSEYTYDRAWKCWAIHASPKILVDKYLAGEFISDPSSGQDPKMFSKENQKTASYHAGNHWGWRVVLAADGNIAQSSPAEWIQYGTFNLVKYNGRLIIEPCNVEHRCWALIGFPLDLVQLKSDRDLWFYHHGLPKSIDIETGTLVSRICVNDMYLSDIVDACNKLNVPISRDTVLERFYMNSFKFQLLPFYTREETEYFFKEINSSSSKSIAQLFHAESHPSMHWSKSFSSPKLTNFKPSGCSLHPLYELMSDADLCKLEALMYTHLIIQFNLNNRQFIASTDKPLTDFYRSHYGYKNEFDEDLKEIVLNDLDTLYSFFSVADKDNLSRQTIQQLLKVIDVLREDGYVIADRKLFIDSFNDWFDENQYDNKQLTEFAGYWRKSGVNEYMGAYRIIKKEFLKNLNLNTLLSIGVTPVTKSVPRIFDRDTVMDSFKKNKGLDIDGSMIETKPVGGHIISDMELIRMTPLERDIAFKSEGLADVYKHDMNCRAMSSYHNHRMGVLRLSEYMSVKDNDGALYTLKMEKYNELKQKPILI